MTQEQNDSRAQIPGASDLPVLGTLFGNRSRSFTKRELVILIKPTVIKSAPTGPRSSAARVNERTTVGHMPSALTDDWLRRPPAAQ
jgi:type II secretory pathway component GspD/PulD (secretin)